MNELPQNRVQMQIDPLPETFSGNYQEVESYSNDVFNKGREILGARKLSDGELLAVSGLVDHLHTAWHREYTDPLVMQGIEVMQSHFARLFGLEPTASYSSVLQEVYSRRYFDKRHGNDPEARAFSKVMVLDIRRRGEAEHLGNEIEVDFSGLVNPDWRHK